jgi:hypothetical protein
MVAGFSRNPIRKEVIVSVARNLYRSSETEKDSGLTLKWITNYFLEVKYGRKKRY